MLRWKNKKKPSTTTSMFFQFPSAMELIVHEFGDCERWVSRGYSPKKPSGVMLPSEFQSMYVVTELPVVERAPCHKVDQGLKKRSDKQTMVPDDANTGEELCLRTEALPEAQDIEVTSLTQFSCQSDDLKATGLF